MTQITRVQDTILWEDVKYITTGPTNPRYFRLTADLKIGDRTVRALNVNSLILTRDYIQNYGDEATTELLFTEEQVQQLIVPHIDDLELVLTRIPLTARDTNSVTVPPTTESFKVVIPSDIITGLGLNNTTPRDLQHSFKSIVCQLISKYTYNLRLESIGGVFAMTTAEDFVKTIISRSLEALDFDTGNEPLGVDFYPSDTADTPRDTLLIKTGTPIVDLPNYVQDNCGGIYNTGLGSYIQNNHWFIYPLYNDQRFNDTRRALHLVMVPQSSLPEQDHSYRVEDGLVMAIVSDAKLQSRTNRAQLTEGNAVALVAPNALKNNFSLKDNSATIANPDAVMGIIASKQRPDGLNKITFSNSRISINAARELSRLSERDLKDVQVSWAYSDPDLVYPGMPVQLVYNEHDLPITLQGVVVGSESMLQMASKGLTNEQWFYKTILHLKVCTPSVVSV